MFRGRAEVPGFTCWNEYKKNLSDTLGLFRQSLWQYVTFLGLQCRNTQSSGVIWKGACYGTVLKLYYLIWPIYPCGNSITWYYPLQASPTPPTYHNSPSPPKIRIKRESQFQLINRRTRPISGGGSNQREPPVLPGSPSPCVSADILFLPISRVPEEQRQSRRNHSGEKLGGKQGIGGIGQYISPRLTACSASQMIYCYIGSDFSPCIHCIIT